MPFHRRLLVTQCGPESNPQLIRYAAMLARIVEPAFAVSARKSSASSQRLRGASAAVRRPKVTRPRATAAPAQAAAGDAEVRFLTLLPQHANAGMGTFAAAARRALRRQVQQNFRVGDGRIEIVCDAVEGQSLRRALAYAKSFGSDLMLVGREEWSPRHLLRLAAASPCATWVVPPDWAPVLRRILVPVDFSLRSLASLRAANYLARRYPPAQCLVLHVDQQDTRCGNDEISPTRQRRLLAELENFLSHVDPHGVRFKPLLVKGHSVPGCIARAAHEHSVDLVVTATRGRTWLASSLLPSVAATTLRECRGAVLVLKAGPVSLGWPEAIRRRLHRPETIPFS